MSPSSQAFACCKPHPPAIICWAWGTHSLSLASGSSPRPSRPLPPSPWLPLSLTTSVKVAQPPSRVRLFLDPMDCSTPPLFITLQALALNEVPLTEHAIQPSRSSCHVLLLLLPQSLPIGAFLMNGPH